MSTNKHHALADDEKGEKNIYRADARVATASKRFAACGLGLQRRGYSVARSFQLAVAQLPNSFVRLNPQSSGARSTGLCI